MMADPEHSHPILSPATAFPQQAYDAVFELLSSGQDDQAKKLILANPVFLDAGAQFGPEPPFGGALNRSPLPKSFARTGRLDMFEWCLAHGARIDLKPEEALPDEHGAALRQILYAGVPFLKAALAHFGPVIVDAPVQENRNHSLLSLAMVNGQTDAVSFLLKSYPERLHMPLEVVNQDGHRVVRADPLSYLDDLLTAKRDPVFASALVPNWLKIRDLLLSLMAADAARKAAQLPSKDLALHHEKPQAFPFVEHTVVFHVGEMDPSLKGSAHASSLEGNGLSVSLHPEEWMQIAKLGGRPTWSLKIPADRPAQFVDAQALKPEHWQTVQEWAVRQGLLLPTELLKLQWHDEESSADRFMLYNASVPKEVADAHLEFEELSENDPDSRSRIERISSFSATPAMDARVGFAVDVAIAKDIALTLYTEDVLFNADENAEIAFSGVWWDDLLDVHALSAPRGVINLRSLPRWRAQLAELADDQSYGDRPVRGAPKPGQPKP